ncbi:MAG: tRNA (adenosine(37)-N6)-dimethylallyltransferase MiaA [Clostridia bacterium]
MVQANSIKPKVIVVTGATASGKSGLSIRLAKEFNGEIISADSVQVYKGLNIGSGKVTESEMSGIIHYNLDILEPNESYSAGKFCEQVDDYISTILAKGKLPIIVGGTVMYVKAWLEGYDFYGSVNCEEKRQKYVKLAEQENITLHQLLQKKSPIMAEKVHENNTKRVLRYLELADEGKENVPTKTMQDKYDVLALKVDVPREELYAKINARVDQMVDEGLVQEVEHLYKQYGDVPALQTIDYKEIVSYLKGEMTLAEAVDKAKQHSRNYAKRQITFMKGMPYLVNCNKNNAFDIVREFLND